jgi:sulfatase maturation enzyme AslB (radical SAM superfamily)
MFFIYEYLQENYDSILGADLEFNLKIITNGTLIDQNYLTLFDSINALPYVNLLIHVSIDGSKETQLHQRNYKK